MGQAEYIKNIARYGLENDREKLLNELNGLIEHSRNSKKINFALQLQSIVKDAIIQPKVSTLVKVGSEPYVNRIEEKELNDLILEKLSSEYRFENLIASKEVKKQLALFVKEHRMTELLQRYELPVSNKVLLYGPSGCGKTLASYVIAGELHKMMVVVNLGAIVSSKLGETSKNLSRIFRRAAAENSVIFLDEFDSLGKVRDYNQDHGEMKRVVNTILQLFDYLPQDCVVIAATNQKDMLDEALVRRFDVKLALECPTTAQMHELIHLTLKKGKFRFDDEAAIEAILHQAGGLSYFSVQKTLITAIKRSLFATDEQTISMQAVIDTNTWRELIAEEKQAQGKG